MIHQPGGPLVVALAIAHSFVGTGCPQDAAAELAARLDTINPDTAAPDAVLIDAAILLAQTGRRVDWARYADRASQALATDLQQMQRAGAVLAALRRGEATIPLSYSPAGPGDGDGDGDAYQRARQAVSRFTAAQQRHGRGACDEAIRDAARVLDDFLHHHRLGVLPIVTAGMVIRFAAMLSACGRDTEARDLITGQAAHLPAPGTSAQRDFADGALELMDQLDQQHAPQCTTLHGSRHLSAGVTSSADGLPWNRRRDDWRLLLAGDTPAGSR